MSNPENITVRRSQRGARVRGRRPIRPLCVVTTEVAGTNNARTPLSLLADCRAWLLMVSLAAAPFALSMAAGPDEVQVLARDQWPSSRTGEIIRQIEPLRRTVETYNGLGEVRILIQYAAGGIGNAWAFEVKEWLIAFGVEAQHVVLQPGSMNEYSLALSVIK